MGVSLSACPPASHLLPPVPLSCLHLWLPLLSDSLSWLPLSWSRPRPTSYSSPLSQLRHTSVCTLPPTRKVAKTRRMRGAAKRKLKATPLQVRDMAEGTWKLTALDQACPHPHPGTCTGHRLTIRHAFWAKKDNPALLAASWHPPPHPHPIVRACCPGTLEEGCLPVEEATSGLKVHGSDPSLCSPFIGIVIGIADMTHLHR